MSYQHFEHTGVKYFCIFQCSLDVSPSVFALLVRRFEYLFNFDSMFEIHDDIEVLKRMGMACGLEVGKCSPEDLKVARSLVPKALEPYVIGECQHLPPEAKMNAVCTMHSSSVYASK